MYEHMQGSPRMSVRENVQLALNKLSGKCILCKSDAKPAMHTLGILPDGKHRIAFFCACEPCLAKPEEVQKAIFAQTEKKP